METRLIGKIISRRFRVEDIIGRGGMAIVYRAFDLKTHQTVAVKVLREEYAEDPEYRERFRREGEVCRKLSHPNVVNLIDAGEVGDVSYLAMEYVDGQTLKELINQTGGIAQEDAIRFTLQILAALGHAHQRGIIHRDVKPQNVMVSRAGQVKVGDFGIAGMADTKTLTTDGNVMGSVHYFSPEQAKGGHTDNRSDIYSLAVVMYEMMTGRPPYDGEPPVAVAIQHINGGAPLPSTLNPNIPRGLEQIIMKGMALEVNDRYVSATEMLHDMEEFRQNPDMTFDYHTIVDDATRVLPNLSRAMTTAEKKVQAKTGAAPVRTSSDSIRLHQNGGGTEAGRDNEAIRRAQQRRQTQQQRKEERKEERSRVATTAIVVCSAVAVIAIFIFLIALFNGALLSKEKALVDVPYLEGGIYDESLASQYPDFAIKLRQEYDDTRPKGEILRTEPSGGSKVVKGSELWITVSLGQRPEAKTMDDFVGTSAEEAKSILLGQGFEPITRNEMSYVYEVGQVIHTEPSAGTEMTAGQTVYIYVSTGPDVITAKMLNVMGLDVDKAKELLGQAGFSNVKTEEVESLKPKGEVIHQSAAKNAEIDVNTEIVLQISKGPEETTGPTQATTPKDPNEPVTIGVQFSLPERDEPYILSIFLNGKEVIESREIVPGTSSFVCDLTGTGTQTYDIYIDGEYYQSKEVPFN